MGMSPLVRATFGPFVEFIRPMPPLAYLSLLVIWIGIGELSKITVLYLAALPPVVINTASAVKSVRIERINGARSLGANDWKGAAAQAHLQEMRRGLDLARDVSDAVQESTGRPARAIRLGLVEHPPEPESIITGSLRDKQRVRTLDGPEIG